MPSEYHAGGIYNTCMVITDVLYDLTVGVTGALVGAFIIALINWRRTRHMSAEIVLRRQDLESLRLENNRLVETIKNRENEILALQKKILKTKTSKK